MQPHTDIFFLHSTEFFFTYDGRIKKYPTFVAPGEMAEWSNAAVLKTVVP